MLSSGETTLVYEFRGPDSNPGVEWTSFEAPLSADANWINLSSRDPLATEEEFRRVLADLEVLRIRGEYRSADDTSYLDDVVLEKGYGTTPGRARSPPIPTELTSGSP